MNKEMPWVNLAQEEVNELRDKKLALTEYGKQKLQKRMHKQVVKFVSVTRTIDPKTQIHYLDAIDEHGVHWMASMEHKTEDWLCYRELWYRDPQQPEAND